MKTKESLIKFVLDNTRMSDKRTQRVMRDVISEFDNRASYDEPNRVIDLLTGGDFKEIKDFDRHIIATMSEKLFYRSTPIEEDTIVIKEINNVSCVVSITYSQEGHEYNDQFSFNNYERCKEEYLKRLADDAADAATK